MLNLGMSEILLFAIIALIVLGPEKLPEAARFAGRWYGKLKRMVSNVQNDIDRELRMSELRDQMQQELKRIKQLEEKMQLQIAQIEKHEVLIDDIAQQHHAHHLELTAHKAFTFCDQSKLKIPYRINQKIVRSPSLLDLKKAV